MCILRLNEMDAKDYGNNNDSLNAYVSLLFTASTADS